MRARGTCLISLLLLAVLQLLSLSNTYASAEAVFDPATDIFWKYGSESGSWDGFDLSQPDSQISVASSPVRTGNKSLRLYQQPPSKTDYQRRVMLQELDTKAEYYASFWVYFPDNLAGTQWNDQWTLVGAMGKKWFKKGSTTYGTQWQLSIQGRDGTGKRPLKMTWYEPFTGINDRVRYPTGYYLEDLLNTWTHIQFQGKWSNSTAGFYRTWINNDLTNELTGIRTDPRGYSQWDSTCYFINDGTSDWGYFAVYNYQDTNSPESWLYYDDLVLSDTKVPETYVVGYRSLEFESWEDGFESGNFSAWDGTQASDPYKAWAKIASTYSYNGTYSANFTTDGSDDSYARAMHTIQPVNEVFQRSYVRFEDLPDTDNTRIWVLRIAQGDGTWIASAGVNRSNGNYYWIIGEAGGRYNTTQGIINADQWYDLEFHFNATINGRARLWVNGALISEMTGDFSSLGTIQRSYPYIYVAEGAQASAKTVYHDNYRIDDARISRRTSMNFQASAYLSTRVEDEPAGSSPLQDVKINGTRLTDEAGYYEWANLPYNKIYTFLVEKPAGYYPGWVLNVEGSYGWNGTHYIISHNVTETQTSPIEIYFSSTEKVFIKSSTHKLASATYNLSSQNSHTLMRFNISADIEVISRIEIYTVDEGHPRPFKIEGAADWNYDSVNKILTIWILHTSEEGAQIEWRGAAMGQ